MHVLAPLILAMAFWSAASAAASTLTGTVKDATGAAIPGAVVTVTTPRQAEVASTVSDAEGRFAIERLGPGSYVVRVTAPGFADTAHPVTVSGADQHLDVELDVAAVRDEVTVTATPGVALDTALALQPVSIITRDDLDQRVTTVVAEALVEEAGVHLQRTSPTMAGVFIRGLTGNKVNVYVDGVRYSNGAQRGGVNTFLDLIDPSGIGGIEVVHGPNSAEYGSDALGGTLHFLSRSAPLSAGGTEVGGEVAAAAQSAHRGGSGQAALSVGRPTVGFFLTAGGRGVGDIRAGGGVDSHAAVTRFFGVPSTALMPERLPDTGFTQGALTAKGNWTPTPRLQVVGSYMATRQDGGNRYDQLLGGDGNLVAALNDLTMDLFYARLERSGLGWFDHGTLTYSVNSQREERVNQGGNGSNTATIGHEPERTTSNAVQGSLTRAASSSATVQIGGDWQWERLTSDAYNVNPVTGAQSVRRPRVPSGARFRQGGAWAQGGASVTEKVRLLGALRVGHAAYEAAAADAPLVNGAPLWPDDAFSTTSVTFRAGALVSASEPWTLVTSVSRGFRAPHMTDLGTLGLTGSGFEVAAPDVDGRGAMVGTTADAAAVSTGEAVRQLVPESSLNVDAGVRFRTRRASWSMTVFVNHIADNIQKQTLILPQGAVGTTLGTEVITAQNANGAVFVAAATNPVLVRANFDRARSWGLEHQGEFQLTPSWRLQTAFTYYNVTDTETGLAPNIEGGIPAPDGYVMLQYAAPGGRWWVQPYVHAAAAQTHLSSLDLTDRRTASPRSRNSIRGFFLNGATNRGWVSAGADGAMGTADDVLTATGETLARIQDRVLGPGVSSGVLFSEVPGYVTLGVRGGLTLGAHQLLVTVDNLGDRNYRGISWGVDAPGRGVSVKYIARF